MVCSPDRARYEIPGPPFYFLIDFRDIITYYSKAEHDDASYDEYEENDSCKAFYCVSAEVFYQGLDSQY